MRRALRLEYGTIAWNAGEAVLTISLGILAGSLALVGFGLDSIIELFASIVVVWHLRPGHETDDPRRTQIALRLVGVSFGLLGVVLVVGSTANLVGGHRPDGSPWGIAYLAVTVLVMLGLALAKRSVATALDSAPVHKEATVTFLDAALAAATLTGLALNAAVGWWWADPAVALVIGLVALNEARESWEEAEEYGPDRLSPTGS